MPNIGPENRRDGACKKARYPRAVECRSAASTRRRNDKLQKRPVQLAKLVNQVLYDTYVASLEQLPKTTPPRGKGDLDGEEETNRFGQGPANNPIGTRCHRLLDGETRRFVQGHPSADFVSAGRRILCI